MSYNILIVDDSAITRAMIKRTLTMAEIPLGLVLEASDGQEGLDLLSKHQIHLALVDLHMPKMSGVEMIQKLLAGDATRHVPAVVVSAEPSTQRLDALKGLGVRACLRKPFTPEGIRAVVNQVLGVAHV